MHQERAPAARNAPLMHQAKLEARLAAIEEKLDQLLQATTHQRTADAPLMHQVIQRELRDIASSATQRTTDAPSMHHVQLAMDGCTTLEPQALGRCTTDAPSMHHSKSATHYRCTTDAPFCEGLARVRVGACAGAIHPAIAIAIANSSKGDDFDAPLLDAPAFDAPAFDAPLLDAPVLDAPVLDAPVLDAPVPQAHQTPGIEALSQRKALNQKRIAFLRIYEALWKKHFSNRAAPIAVLENMRRFRDREELHSLSEGEWTSCVEQWVADPRMAHKGWPVSFLIAGITTDYAPDRSVPSEEGTIATTDKDIGQNETPNRLQQLLTEGWLRYDDWKSWPLAKDLPRLANALYALRFSWEGHDVWPPLRAQAQGNEIALITRGNDCGYWSMENLRILAGVAKSAGYTLRQIIGEDGFVWWSASAQSSANA